MPPMNMNTDEFVGQNMIRANILECIGDTPVVRINRIAQAEGIECDLVVKCEYFSAGGSVKDRIAKRMIEDAESRGVMKPGDTIIVPTSGNTGIGLALCAAVKGLQTVITMPEKMSMEKQEVLTMLGADVRRTPTDLHPDDPGSYISLAREIAEKTGAVIMDQYLDEGNPKVHEEVTANEIWEQCGGKVDMVVIGVGTGGTITGVARGLKKRNPNLKVVGVDPHGSMLASMDHQIHPYLLEGIGYDFIPQVLDLRVVDSWEKVGDAESFMMARRLVRDEGLLCGGSSGAAMVAALRVAKKVPKGNRVLVILPDSIRNYLSTYLNDDWMKKKGFGDCLSSSSIQKDSSIPHSPLLQHQSWIEKRPVQWSWSDLKQDDLSMPYVPCIDVSRSCLDAFVLLCKSKHPFLVVTTGHRPQVVGVLCDKDFESVMWKMDPCAKDQPISNIMSVQFGIVAVDVPFENLYKVLMNNLYAVVALEKSQTSGTDMWYTTVITRFLFAKYLFEDNPMVKNNE